MKKFITKKAGKKGQGLFANKNFEKGEKILSVDLTKLKNHTPKEWKNLPEDDSHIDYIGRGRYVVSHHPYSYINHSCDPNVLIKFKSIAKSDFFAMRNIKKGEEFTYDYGVNAMDQIENNKWHIKCKCRSKNCRKIIPCSFFKQPLSIQKKYYKCLPPSIKRKYRDKLRKLATK